MRYRYTDENGFIQVTTEIPTGYDYVEIPDEVVINYVEVPQTISQRQLRTQLVLNGFVLSNIETAIHNLDEPEKSIALIAWEYAITFERNSELLISLAYMLNLSDEDLDNIFINAAKL